MKITGQDYALIIDGALFRRQRQYLLQLAEDARHQHSLSVNDLDAELLEGLVNLTDAIADQALDRHGIDCRLGK